MVLMKEYRICMPMSVNEYRIGQLYMIARHSYEQSGDGEGVEVIENKPCKDIEHGEGQFTEKRIHISSRLPYWIQAIIPKVFYVTEKSWNYFPFTITEYTCSFIPRFHVCIETKYEDNNGSSENCLNISSEQLPERIVDNIDIAYDELSPKHYKEEEDLKFFESEKVHRGPLFEGWRNTTSPIMCSYKLVKVSFEVFGFQTRVEEFIQSCIREVLLLGHRQAFAWIDEWYDMTIDDVRKYESDLQNKTNLKVKIIDSSPITNEEVEFPSSSSSSSLSPASPKSPKSPLKKGYFSWFY